MIEFFVKLLLIFGSYAFLYWTFAYALEQGKLIYQKEAKEKEEAQHQQVSGAEEQLPKKKKNYQSVTLSKNHYGSSFFVPSGTVFLLEYIKKEKKYHDN